MKIALDECIEMMGKDLVKKYKESCCSAYGTKENGMFSYCLGLEMEDTPDTEDSFRLMGGETPMDYYAFVIVDPQTGKVTRDYENSTLPD